MRLGDEYMRQWTLNITLDNDDIISTGQFDP